MGSNRDRGCPVCMAGRGRECPCDLEAQLDPGQMADLVREHFADEDRYGGAGAWQEKMARRILGLELDDNGRPRRLYARVSHVSRSGMLRRIDLLAVFGDSLMLIRPEWFTTYKQDKNRDGYRVGGCGMDMTFALASSMFEQTKRALDIGYEQWPYQLHLPNVSVL